jgi:hypothetical protein
MKKALCFRNIFASALCTLVFFITYYSGIFFNLKISFITAAVITSLLLISVGLNDWAVKTAFYFITVILLNSVIQAYSLTKILGEKIDFQLENISWGEQLTISNCLWFAVVFGCSMLSLGISAVIAYRKGALI